VLSRFSVLHLSNSASIVSIDDSASDNHPKKLSNDLSKFCKEFIAECNTFPRLIMLKNNFTINKKIFLNMSKNIFLILKKKLT
jgi:hypothetical protein